MNKKRQRRMNYLMNIILCLVALVSLTVCIFLLLKNYQFNFETTEALAQVEQIKEDTKDYIYTQSDVNSFVEEAVLNAQTTEARKLLDDIKSRMESGDSTAAVLRELYPEDVVVYADSKYNFFPSIRERSTGRRWLPMVLTLHLSESVSGEARKGSLWRMNILLITLKAH